MCGHSDHMHDIHSQYDPETGVLRFIQKCAACVWSRVIHQEDYRPAPAFDGCVIHMDQAALLSHVKKLGYTRVAIIGQRSHKQAVRRAA